MKALSGERRNAVPSLNPASGSPPGRTTGGAGTTTTGGGGGASIGGGIGAAGAGAAGVDGTGSAGAAGPGATWATGAPGGTGICATAGADSSETRATAAVREVFFMARHVTPHLLQPCGVGVKSLETRP